MAFAHLIELAFLPSPGLYPLALLSVWGFGIAALLFMRGACGRLAQALYWRQGESEIRTTRTVLANVRAKSPARGKWVTGLAMLAMFGLGGYCGWNLVGDYARAHAIVEGRVDGARIVRHTRSPDDYERIIDRTAHPIPRDLLENLHRVEAEVGVASGTVLAIRRLP